MPMQARPLSPHLGIFRWYLTMTLSILHRATGVALAVGTLLVIALLLALAAGPEPYGTVHAFCRSPLGMLLLVGWTFSLCLHSLNGIRHLGWDFGWGFAVPTANATAWIVVVLSVLLTALIWVAALAGGGAA